MEDLQTIKNNVDDFNQRVDHISSKVKLTFNTHVKVERIDLSKLSEPKYYNSAYRLYVKNVHQMMLKSCTKLVTQLVQFNIIPPRFSPLVFDWEQINKTLSDIENRLSKY